MSKANTSAALTTEMEELVESLGDFMAFWGFEKVQGQIWALLFLSAEPLSESELSIKLSIEQSSLTEHLDFLLKYKVLSKSTKGDEQLFETNEDLLKVITSVLKERELKLLLQIRQKAEAFMSGSFHGPNHFSSKSRMSSLVQMTKTAENYIRTIVKIGSIKFPSVKNPFRK